MVDERASPVLGKVDSITIASDSDLVTYVEGELINTLSRMGFAVRQVEPAAPKAGRHRVLASLVGAQLSSESTLLYPVAAAVRIRIEVTDDSGESMFRKEIRGALSRDLGRHTQGGPEDAQLLAEVIEQAFLRLSVDESFVLGVSMSREEAEARRVLDEKARPAAKEVESREGPTAGSVADRLGTLDRLLEEGLINQADYDRSRKEILDDL